MFSPEAWLSIALMSRRETCRVPAYLSRRKSTAGTCRDAFNFRTAERPVLFAVPLSVLLV